MKTTQAIFTKARKIKLVIFDVDGVLTTGRLYYTAEGEAQKVFHVHDGLGIQLLQQAEIAVAIITSRNSPAVTKRFTELGVIHIFQGQTNKLQAYENLLQQLQLRDEQVACVGDDWPDIALFKRAGLSIAVANAVSLVRATADWQTQQRGGEGAAREVCELILKAQEKLEPLCNHYAH